MSFSSRYEFQMSIKLFFHTYQDLDFKLNIIVVDANDFLLNKILCSHIDKLKFSVQCRR